LQARTIHSDSKIDPARIENGLIGTEILVAEPDQEARDRLRNIVPLAGGGSLQIFESLDAIADHTSATRDSIDWLVLAVKPQHAQASLTVVSQRTSALIARSRLLSIAAGLPIDLLSQWSGQRRIVRAMPNTPAMIGEGACGAFADPSVDAQERQQADAILSGMGQLVWVTDESLIDAVTALSGSGPAYVFRMIEILRDAGTALGLDKEESYRLTVQTFRGAIALLEQSPEEPEALRERVTSKGGTTQAALESMERLGLARVLQESVKAAHARAQALATEAGKKT
jgi:pyrroline-5-carboxylate reductase